MRLFHAILTPDLNELRVLGYQGIYFVILQIEARLPLLLSEYYRIITY